MLNISKATTLLSLPLLMLSSCTLGEPKWEDFSEVGEMRLTSIKSFGMPMMSFDYDNQGHMTHITYGLSSDASDVKLNWEGGKLVSIVTTEHDTYWDSNTDKDVDYISEISTWSDIRTNDAGYITSYKYEERSFRYEYDDRTGTFSIVEDKLNAENGVGTIEYDAAGHITASREDGELVSKIEWKNDLLISITEIGEPSSGIEDEVTLYEYSDVTNQHLQWDPFTFDEFGVMAVTGLFGKAPARYVKTSTFEWNGNIQDFAYNIGSNGYIRAIRFNDEGDLLTLNFKYEKGAVNIK